MSRYIVGFLVGYCVNSYCDINKLFYYGQYYLPKSLNPMITKPIQSSICDSHWRMHVEECEKKNEDYYADLRKKINE